MNFSYEYLTETITILNHINKDEIESLAQGLQNTSARGGRLFVLGVGGSCATASHAINDFRKICNIEAYAPTDNVSELTATTNDSGFEYSFINWLKTSRLSKEDSILIFSVGGGNQEKNVSMNIVKAIDYAKEKQANIYGIVGKDGGYTAKNATACVVIPTLNADRITPHVEGIASVILHLLVSHPALKVNQTKWESTK
jgi:D-sedoheptulose 7-phosphate isomerase